MSEKLLSALVAGVVAIGISLISAYFQRRAFRQVVESKYSEKLIDLRLDNYQSAFEIVGKISLTKGRRSQKDTLKIITEELRSWHSGPASMVMSSKSQNAYNRLRRRLISTYESSSELNDDQSNAEKLFAAISGFRHALKFDLRLLFNELESEKFDDHSE